MTQSSERLEFQHSVLCPDGGKCRAVASLARTRESPRWFP